VDKQDWMMSETVLQLQSEKQLETVNHTKLKQ